MKEEYSEINLRIHKNILREMRNIVTISGAVGELTKATEILMKIVEGIEDKAPVVTLINKRDVKERQGERCSLLPRSIVLEIKRRS